MLNSLLNDPLREKSSITVVAKFSRIKLIFKILIKNLTILNENFKMFGIIAKLSKIFDYQIH